MRVRTIELRILALALAGLWLAAFGLIVVGYRPGGPLDLVVGAAAAGPALVAVAAVAWPPVARSDRAFTGIVWLGLGAGLLLVPLIGDIASRLAARGPQTLLPSLQAAYPWLLALLATALFAGLGIARRRLGETALRRRRLLAGSLLAVAMTLVAGTVFSAAAIVNELSMGNRPTVVSRFGPTDPAIEPPPCTGDLAAGRTSRVELRMDAELDGRRTGQVVIAGVRDGTDVRWSGFAASDVLVGQVGIARIGDDAWRRRPDSGWRRTTLEAAAANELDLRLVTEVLTPVNRAVADDLGLDFIEGARARHCRTTADGTALRGALPQLALLLGSTDLEGWRVDLDYWVFGDGQLGLVDGRASGPAGGLADDALIATVRLRLSAVDRDTRITVSPPAR
jgi:hypothetical protein